MSCYIPKICSLSLGVGQASWVLRYYDQDREVVQERDLLSQLGALLSAENLTNFRQQIHLQTVPFLLAVDYGKRRISLLSPRGHRELFLLERLQEDELSEQERALYRELKEHVHEALSMGPHSFPSSVDKLTRSFNLPNLSDAKWGALDSQMGTLRQKLLPLVQGHRRSLLERCTDYGLSLTAQYDLVRIHLLKFVAVLSALDFDRKGHEVKRLLEESLRRFVQGAKKVREQPRQGEQGLPGLLLLCFQVIWLLVCLFPARLLAWPVRFSVKLMAKRFIAGESIEKAKDELSALMSSGRDATLDQLGELVLSSEEADRYESDILKLIHFYGKLVSQGEKNRAGINRAHISLKVSALCHDFNPYAFNHSYRQVAPRLQRILEEAKAQQVFINIDAEHYSYRDTVFAIYKKLLLETSSLENYQQTGIVVQAYLRDAYGHLGQIIQLAKQRQLTMPIRLVKGAYWDAETIEAKAHSYNAPQFLNKWETDTHYRQLMIEVLKNFPHVQLCLGGHNLDDHCYGEVLRQKYFPHTPLIEHQCLHMTYEGLSVAMAKYGFVVRNYVPIGPLLVGMSYLVRRIMENSSQVGVLVQMRSGGGGVGRSAATAAGDLQREEDSGAEEMSDKFFNIPPVRLFLSEEREAFEEGGEKFNREGKGKHYGDRHDTEESKIYSSSDRECVVGSINFVGVKDVDKAVLSSRRAFEQVGGWADFSCAKRAGHLLTVAQGLLVNRVQLAHLISFEAGKTPTEALGDVDEAVDFLHYYARSEHSLHPRGPVAVISPWNFPLAIPCGMVAAALVAGNTVLLKSAEQTPLTAQRLVDLFEQAGLPPDVLIHLPGKGETVGAALVESAEVAQVVFTGSREVGLEIAQKCLGRVYHNRRENAFYPVKAVTEMGGKNGIILTADADLDEAVSGVLYSAYAHAGQKCSACSRVLVDERVVERFIHRFAQASRDITVGKSYCPETWINPLITSQEKHRLLSLEEEIIGEAKEFFGKVHVNRLAEELPGNCVGPMVVALPASRAFVEESFLQRELFAPVVHVVSYRDLFEAVEIFNSTPYALTGGIYAQSQDEIDFLAERMECGNIYVNRPNTGARVGIEPFGGFKLSGSGPKAGGENYVRAFMFEQNEAWPTSPELSPEKSIKIESVGRGQEKEDNFFLADPCILELSRRIYCLSLGLQVCLDRLAFEGMAQEMLMPLEDYKCWLDSGGLQEAIGRERENISVPGQLSYTNFSLSKEHVVAMVEKSSFDPQVLVSIVSALAAGSGVNVVCTSAEAFDTWSKIVEHFVVAGLYEGSIHCQLILFSQLQQVLGHPKVSVYLFDGNRDLISLAQFSSFFYCRQIRSEHVKNIYPLCKGREGRQFSEYVLNFIQVRSFAVNTMRHGAPLDFSRVDDG